MATPTDKQPDAAAKPVEAKVRLRYLGDKRIEHTLTGLVFTKHVMHTLTAAQADDLRYRSPGEEFEEIK